MKNTVYLSLGANLGDRKANLREALRRLGDLGTLAAVSSFYETEPVEVERLLRVGPRRVKRVLRGVAGAPDSEDSDDQQQHQQRAGAAGEGLLRQSQVACVLINENRAWS